MTLHRNRFSFDSCPADQTPSARNLDWFPLRLSIKAGFRPDQPRIPAGTTDAGRWSKESGISPSPGSGAKDLKERVVTDRTGDEPWSTYVARSRPDGTVVSRTVQNRDASRIETIFLAKDTERNAVILRDGTRFVFEDRSDTQRIFDGSSRLLSESRWRSRGSEPRAGVWLASEAIQRRPRPERIMPLMGDNTLPLIGAAIAIFNWHSSMQFQEKVSVLAFTARQYGNTVAVGSIDWARPLARENVEAVCRKLRTVEELATAAAKKYRPNMFKSAAARGTAIHLAVKEQVNGGVGRARDSNFQSEVSIVKSRQVEESQSARYGQPGSIRIDVLERAAPDVVCVYDLKTGTRGLNAPRMQEIA